MTNLQLQIIFGDRGILKQQIKLEIANDNIKLGMAFGFAIDLEKVGSLIYRKEELIKNREIEFWRWEVRY